MTTKKLYRYKVTVIGAFPLDMLRYDNCWFERTNDCWISHQSQELPNIIKTEYILQSHKQPTIARWKSFGAIVEELK